jgi:3-deoxy-D-manno-octulosonic acid (KDO) 8-phosphate synthase
MDSRTHAQEGGAPVVMDVTHCLQQPSARREERPDGSARVVSGGDGGRVALVPAMGSMALALGARGVFIEAFPHPPPRAGVPRGTDARAARLLAAARALTRGVARQQIDEDPLSAPCDGPLQWPAHELAPVIRQWARVAAALEHRSAQHT